MTKTLSLWAVSFVLCLGSLRAETPAKPVAAAMAGSTGSPQATVAVKPATSPAAASPAPAAPAAKAGSTGSPQAAGADEEAGIQRLFQDLTTAWTAGDAKLMASHWLKDGSLISPMGQEAWNRDEVEQVVGADIRHFGGVNTFSDLKINVILKGGFALVDAKAVISGLKNADGTAAPDLEHHVYGAVANRGGKWYIKALRPYVFVQAPVAAAPAAAPAAPVVAPADAKKDSKKKKD